MARFAIESTTLAGLRIVERQPIGDERGFLNRIYCEIELGDLGFKDGIVQINHSLTRRSGTVRGMHFQVPPHAETKLVSCIRGAVFDVAVDLRKGSSTFLQWHGDVLSGENNRAFLIPQGFAHGFQALEENCELLYLHSAAYEPGAEGGLNIADPRLDISWPMPVSDLSERDRTHAMLGDDFEGIEL